METLDRLYWASSTASAALALAFGALSLGRAREKDGGLLFYLLAGYFACAFLCGVYYTLTTILLEYPYVISPGDLSWVGAIAFLITADVDATDKWGAAEKANANKRRLTAIAAPAVVCAFNVTYISIYPEIVANYLLYAIPTAVLAYYALWLFLAERRMRVFHAVTLMWLAFQLMHDLFSTFGGYEGYLPHMVVCAWLVTLITPLPYIAARKGAGA